MASWTFDEIYMPFFCSILIKKKNSTAFWQDSHFFSRSSDEIHGFFHNSSTKFEVFLTMFCHISHIFHDLPEFTYFPRSFDTICILFSRSFYKICIFSMFFHLKTCIFHNFSSKFACFIWSIDKSHIFFEVLWQNLQFIDKFAYFLQSLAKMCPPPPIKNVIRL